MWVYLVVFLLDTVHIVNNMVTFPETKQQVPPWQWMVSIGIHGCQLVVIEHHPDIYTPKI